MLTSTHKRHSIFCVNWWEMGRLLWLRLRQIPARYRELALTQNNRKMSTVHCHGSLSSAGEKVAAGAPTTARRMVVTSTVDLEYEDDSEDDLQDSLTLPRIEEVLRSEGIADDSITQQLDKIKTRFVRGTSHVWYYSTMVIVVMMMIPIKFCVYVRVCQLLNTYCNTHCAYRRKSWY